MSTLSIVLIGWLATIVIFSGLWVLQRRTGDAGIVDVAWGTCVGLLAIFFCVTSTTGNATRRTIVATLAMLWAARLSWYVLQRCWKMPEDGRYQELKEQWGDETDARMFRFYQFQAAASVLFALPMLIAAWNDQPIGWLDFSAIALWMIAIGGETLADLQLDAFRHDPANQGKVCQTGLWKYSRHPNYFFEWLHWWSYVLLAITGSWGWLAVFAPMTMLFFILKVTGIPPTERQAIKSRGEALSKVSNDNQCFFPVVSKNGCRIS